MATDPNDTSQSQHIQLQKLLAGKQLRRWTTSDVILWLQSANDGLFSKYTNLFETNQINGHTLMTLDNEKNASELLGTQHQINTFIQSIKQLKSKNGRKMSIHRRRQSRSRQSLMGIETSQFQIKMMQSKSTRDLTNRSSTPTNNKSNPRKFRSRAISSSNQDQYTFNGHKRSATPTSNGFSIKSPRSPTLNDMSPKSELFPRQRSLSHGDANEEPTDKKSLWKLYKDRQTYSAILAKRGKFNTSFKNRWLVLCESNNKKTNKCKPMRTMSNSITANDTYESKSPMISKAHTDNFSLGSANQRKKLKNKFRSGKYGNNKVNRGNGYLFYFTERPIKDNDFPNGFINLNGVECVIGLMDENENKDKDKGNKIKYLKKKV
eukprot:803349_1